MNTTAPQVEPQWDLSLASSGSSFLPQGEESESLASLSVSGAAAVLEGLAFETFPTDSGPGYRFVQRAGKSMRDIEQALTIVSLHRHGRDVFCQRSRKRANRNCSETTIATKDIVHEIVPVVIGCENKTPAQQKARLKELGMKDGARGILRVVAGLYRLEVGFPADADMGTEDDSGDVFNGKRIRVADGAVATSVGGICDANFKDGGSSRVGRAGVPVKKP